MFYIRAYTFMYVCDTSCTYTIRSAPYVVRILHVFASIIENIRAHVNPYFNFFGHSAIVLQLISQYLADATTFIGLVGRGCRSDGGNVSNTTVFYDSRMIHRVLHRNR